MIKVENLSTLPQSPWAGIAKLSAPPLASWPARWCHQNTWLIIVGLQKCYQDITLTTADTAYLDNILHKSTINQSILWWPCEVWHGVVWWPLTMPHLSKKSPYKTNPIHIKLTWSPFSLSRRVTQTTADLIPDMLVNKYNYTVKQYNTEKNTWSRPCWSTNTITENKYLIPAMLIKIQIQIPDPSHVGQGGKHQRLHLHVCHSLVFVIWPKYCWQ